MLNHSTGSFNFGFADVSWVGYCESLPDDVKEELERHSDEIKSGRELKRYAQIALQHRS